MDNVEPVEQELEAAMETADQETPSSWAIRDRNTAFWAMRKMATLTRQLQMLQQERDAEVQRVERWLEREAKPIRQRMGFLQHHLEMYHRQVLAEDPKQKTMRTPWGALQLRQSPPEWQYQDEVLVGWLQEHAPALLRVRQEAERTALKGQVQLVPGDTPGEWTAVLAETGEVVPGLLVREREPRFTLVLEGAEG